jgi:hypothetical protein
VLGIRVVRGTLTLVSAESTAERLLTLRSLTHESTSALGAAEAASALRGHAEASETRLHARRSLTVPSARRRLVTELTKRGGGYEWVSSAYDNHVECDNSHTLLRRHRVGALAVLREERRSLRVAGLRESTSRLREAASRLVETSAGGRAVLAPLYQKSARDRVM